MKLKLIISGAFAVLFAMAPLGAKATEVYNGPSSQEVGLLYFRYLEAAYYAADSNAPLSGNSVYNTLLPYGTNVAQYGMLTVLASVESEPYFSGGYLGSSYYRFLGGVYASASYANPAYANQLWAFYENYAQGIQSSTSASGEWVYLYYSTPAQYWYTQATSSYY